MRQVPTVDFDWKAWAPDLAAGLVVFGLGLLEIGTTYGLRDDRGDIAWIVFPTALAVGLSRRLPSVALVLVWLTCSLQMTGTMQIFYVQLTYAAVSFGTARWGRPLTVLASALSIPLAGILAVRYASSSMFAIIFGSARYNSIYDTVRQLGTTWQLGAAILGMALLGVPWLAGLAFRLNSRAADSRASQRIAEEEAARAQRESEQAREIARLREEQTQLAHDVHDVVGHSLAVILAQAESAQFLDEADTAALRLSMSNIANSARGSLRDVRNVLTPTPESASGPGALTDLIDGVRVSGHEVAYTVTGIERPLAPELATVAYRVLQEMLTNAIRHGSRDEPLRVALTWSDSLRIEVVNAVGVHHPPPGQGDPSGGQGIDGMRRRLESVGGRLDIDRSAGTFTAAASVPLRTVYA